MPPERDAVLVRFWGTRGSIPVAMTSAEVKRKLVAALVKGAGRGLDTPDKARAFVEEDLDFTVSHTFGGNLPANGTYKNFENDQHRTTKVILILPNPFLSVDERRG